MGYLYSLPLLLLDDLGGSVDGRIRWARARPMVVYQYSRCYDTHYDATFGFAGLGSLRGKVDGKTTAHKSSYQGVCPAE